MTKRKISLAAIVAAFCVCGARATEYTYADPVFYVTNPLGSLTNDLSECTFTKSVGGETSESSWSEFAAATSGTLVKQGTGWITVTSSLESFAGEIHVEAGVWDVCNQYGIGSYVGGAAFAHDGATIIMERKSEYMSWIPPYNVEQKGPGNTKAIVMEGEGAEGMRGALVATGGTGNSDFFAIARYPTLTNDATIIIDQTSLMMNWRPAAVMKPNGHAVTIKGAPGLTRPPFIVNNAAIEVGTVICDNIIFRLNYEPVLYGGSNGRLVMQGQSDLDLNMASNMSAPNFGWTLDCQDMRLVKLNGADAGRNYLPEDNAKSAWFGPVLLNCDMPLYNGASTATEALPNRHRLGLHLHGPVSGSHGIGLYAAAKRYVSDITLGLFSPDNSFKGGVTLGDGSTLALWANGALPADGGAATITNGTVILYGNDVYSLPTLHIHGTGTVKQASQSGGSWSSIVKTGDGVLAYDASSGAESVSVQGGTLRIMPSHFFTPGLSEWTNKTGTTGWNNRVYYQSPITSNCVRVGMTSSQGQWLTDHHMPDEVYPNLSFGVSYRGYIWNNSGKTETWTFGTVVDKGGKLYIDDELIFAQPARNEAITSNVVITPGPHKFEFNYYNESGSSGSSSVKTTTGVTFHYIDDVEFDCENKNPSYSTTDNGDGTITTNGCWSNGYGFVLDRQGRRSHFYTDYERPQDPGDGSVFTVDIEEFADSAPHFGAMEFAIGTTLDLMHLPLPFEIGNLAGLPAVTNGSIAVDGTWTVSANDVAAGGRMAVDGALSFGAAAAICVTEDGHLHSSPEGGWTMAEAEGGISLAEGWQGRVTLPSGKYTLALSPDGKRLVLTRTNGFMLTIR